MRLLTEPPEALVAVIAWDSGDGEVTEVNVWETPGAVADFFMERVRPIVEAEGEPPNKPQRHGEPIAFYLRHQPLPARHTDGCIPGRFTGRTTGRTRIVMENARAARIGVAHSTFLYPRLLCS